MVMLVGEMDYLDLKFKHWLGYVFFVFFVFLLVIVLMNILNGLAVDDIHKIQEEADTYHLVSIVETLAYTSFVSLLATEIVIAPNLKPERRRILGIALPGTKVRPNLITQLSYASSMIIHSAALLRSVVRVLLPRSCKCVLYSYNAIETAGKS